MSQTRSIMVGLIATLALCAAIASSANAAGWMVGGTDLTSSAALAPTAAVIEGITLTSAGITVQCASSEAGTEGDIHTQSFILFRYKWLECEPTTSSCTLSSKEIRTVPIDGEVTLEGLAAVKVGLKPATGTLLATIEFLGSQCAFLGLVPIIGKATVSGPTGQSEDTVQEIEMNVTAASGELKLGANQAALKGKVYFKLGSSRPWSFL
jgi:hypothetical protein